MVKSYALLLAGWCMRLFSCADSETATSHLLGISLINLWHDLLERGGIETLRQYGCPADDVLVCVGAVLTSEATCWRLPVR